MRVLSHVLSVAIVLSFAVSPGFAQDGAQKKAKRAPKPAAPTTSISGQVRQAVPGIEAVVKLSDEQKAKIAETRKKAMSTEKVAAAQKTMKDKNASAEAKKAAREVVRGANRSAQTQVAKVYGKGQVELIGKINAAAQAASAKVKAEYREKLKGTKGNKEARQKLMKESGEKTRAAVAKAVTAMLSPDQKAAIKKAAAEKAEAAKKRAAKKKDAEKKRAAKKKGPDKKGDADKKKTAEKKRAAKKKDGEAKKKRAPKKKDGKKKDAEKKTKI